MYQQREGECFKAFYSAGTNAHAFPSEFHRRSVLLWGASVISGGDERRERVPIST